MSPPLSLDAYLARWSGGDKRKSGIAEVVLALAQASISISRRIARGALDGAMGAAIGQNAGGDSQKALDVWTNDILVAALRSADVRALASEEEEAPLPLDPGGTWLVAFDPLDGSSNIDTNLSVGTIFSVLPAREDESFGLLQSGRAQVAAGYVIYGPQTMLMLTLGQGSMAFTLDPVGRQYLLTADKLSIAAKSNEYAINSANARHWSVEIKTYIDQRLAGADGPRGSESNMRWCGSLVADCQRILTRGGVFLYPGDSRPGYAQGRLRLLYEANPIAFLVEQAGGAATDGREPILNLKPTAPHQRTPLIFGTPAEVALIPKPSSETA